MRQRLFNALVAAALVGGIVPGLAPGPARAAKDLGAAVAPIRLVPNGDTTISVSGLHEFFGSIELDAASNGIVVSNRLSLERYLLGLNEVPTDWPPEALRAQAVAARTYALNTLAQGPAGDAAVYGFDICATVECQVFSGAEVVAAEDGRRWQAAVESTVGQAVLYEGAPILARYHSTSGGQTLDNEDAFPDEPAYPYLKSVPSETEQGAPLYRWTTTFRVNELEAILRRVGWWGNHGRLVSARTVSSAQRLHYPDVLFDGRKGNVRKTAEELRDVVRDLAPAMFPGRYPSSAPTASGVLPETFPSNRITISTRGKIVEVVGRGWGHGSGMSQWGAHGLAQQGASYTDILAHYYTGTSVGRVPAGPPIEVGVQWGASSVQAGGSFDIVDGRGKTIVRGALGTWNFAWAGDGAVAIDPPAGYGLPLEVGIVNAPRRVKVGEAAFLTVALSRPAKVRTETSTSPTGYRDPGVEVRDAGRRRVVWLAPLEEGRYRVRVRARAGPTLRRSEPIEIIVTPAVARSVDEPGDRPADENENRPPYVLIVALAAGFLGVVIALLVARGRKRPAG